LCESNEQYVPLNDGYNWKGDPNATLSGQAIPQLPPGTPPPPLGMPTAPPPPALVGAAEYDPASGTYVAPNGREYTQSNLAEPTKGDNTWQSMLLPPGS
jgi:phospholipid/cholesterol/gamma-HCH transport system substrate-binding protein